MAAQLRMAQQGMGLTHLTNNQRKGNEAKKACAELSLTVLYRSIVKYYWTLLRDYIRSYTLCM